MGQTLVERTGMGQTLVEQTGVASHRHDRPMNGLTVAIVDDDPAFGAALASLVDQVPGLTACYSVARADDAIALLRSTRVDLALVDVRMPGGGGLAVVEALKACEHPRAIILMSADPRPDQLPSGVRFVEKVELEYSFLQSVASELRSC